MCTEVTFGQNKYTCCSVGFKLVKSSGNYVEPTLFSDSIHNIFEMPHFGDPNTLYVTEEMSHLI